MTAVVALLPPGWLRPWTNDLEALATFPLAPFGHAGNSLASWLRHPPDPLSDLPPAAAERLRKAELEMERFARLYRESERRVIQLEREVAELELVPLLQMPNETAPLRASITRRTPGKSQGVVHLNRGESAGVQPNTVAVYGGTHIVGRITEVTRLQSTLLPISNVSTPPINAKVYPRDHPELSPRDAPVAQLIPVGDGTFRADADRAYGLAVGDIVYLYDHTWPDSAQHLLIGTITAMRPKDNAPLRDAIIVEPQYQVVGVSAVTLLIDRGGQGQNPEASVALEDGS
jgi:hypothetical protein